MVGVGTMFPIHGVRVRQMVLMLGFVVTAALGALGGTLFAHAPSLPRVAAAPARAHMALYVQIQTWQAGSQSTDRRLSLQAVVVNESGGTAPAPAVQDFTVRDAGGRTWSVSPAGSAFSTVALQPGEQRGLDMIVDLPASASQLRLVMLHGGQVDSIPLVA